MFECLFGKFVVTTATFGSTTGNLAVVGVVVQLGCDCHGSLMMGRFLCCCGNHCVVVVMETLLFVPVGLWRCMEEMRTVASGISHTPCSSPGDSSQVC